MTGELRLITADDLCAGAQTVLAAQLEALIEALGLDEGRRPYLVPKTWDQVPTLEAVQKALGPNRAAGAITSTGLVGTPRTSRSGIDATWLIRVGIFDRGSDYNVTAERVRTWAALVRAVMLHNPTLAGVATGVRWVAETYRNYPQKEVARTLGGCTVDFHVDARNVADLDAILGVLPVVESTFSTVTVRPPQE